MCLRGHLISYSYKLSRRVGKDLNPRVVLLRTKHALRARCCQGEADFNGDGKIDFDEPLGHVLEGDQSREWRSLACFGHGNRIAVIE